MSRLMAFLMIFSIWSIVTAFQVFFLVWSGGKLLILVMIITSLIFANIAALQDRELKRIQRRYKEVK